MCNSCLLRFLFDKVKLSIFAIISSKLFISLFIMCRSKILHNVGVILLGFSLLILLGHSFVPHHRHVSTQEHMERNKLCFAFEHQDHISTPVTAKTFDLNDAHGHEHMHHNCSLIEVLKHAKTAKKQINVELFRLQLFVLLPYDAQGLTSSRVHLQSLFEPVIFCYTYDHSASSGLRAPPSLV